MIYWQQRKNVQCMRECVCVCEFASKRRCMIKIKAVFSRLKLHSPSCCGAVVEGSEKRPEKKAETKL